MTVVQLRAFILVRFDKPAAVVVLLEVGVDAIRADADSVSNAEAVADGFGPGVEDQLELENPVDEVLGRGCVRGSTWRVDPLEVTRVAVFIDEVLDASAADLELLSNQGGVHVVTNNHLINPGGSIPVELHCTRSTIGEMMTTKSLAYPTRGDPIPNW